MRFSEIIDTWFESKKGLVKESTLSAYYVALRSHIRPYWGNKDTITCARNELQLFVNNCISMGLSVKSAKDMDIIMRQIIMWANDELDARIGISLKVKYPKKSMQEKTQNRVYTKAECAMFVQHFEKTKDLVALGVVVALYSGMRIGEISGLQFGDIDVEHNTIQVRRIVERIVDIQSGKTKVVIGLPKTITSQRTIPLHNSVANYIKPLLDYYPKNYYLLSGSDKPVEPRTFRNKYYRLCKLIGITKPLNFHSIRHTCATHLIEAGNDVKNVSAILGHSDVTTTLNIYTHATQSKQAQAINTLAYG